MRIDPGDSFAGALIITGGGVEGGHRALYLGIVEKHGIALVADEVSDHIGIELPQQVAGHVHGLQLRSQGPGGAFVDLVPGQAFIPGNMIGFAQGVDIAHQAYEGDGEVPAVGQGPEGGSVAGDDDPLAQPDPLQHLEGTLRSMYGDGEAALAIGMAGADDRDGEEPLIPGVPQHPLAGGLVAAVFPVGVMQGRSLRNPGRGEGLLVGGGGGDEKVLITFSFEEPDIPLHIGDGEGDEIRHHVIVLLADEGANVLFLMYIADDDPGAFRHATPGLAPIQQGQFPALGHAKL